MADNVDITPGTGKTVAADDVGGVMYQTVKHDIGGDGVSVPLVAGQQVAAESAPVVVASDQPAIATSVADGDNAALGATTDAAVTTDTNGTAIGFLRGLVTHMVALLSRIPAALGANGGLKVEGVASGTVVPVSDGAGSLTVDGDVTVTSPDIVVTVTPTLDTSAYAAGDLLFDSTEIAAAVRVNGGYTVLESITMLDKGDQGVGMTLLFANAATDFGTLNAAPDPDDTESGTVIGLFPIVAADYLDLGANKVACCRNIGLMMKAGAATTSLYVAAVNGTGTPTYANGDLVIQLGFYRS